eukprot:1590351-Amphidinium_carterae.1
MHRSVPENLNPLSVVVEFRGKTLDWAVTWSSLGGVAMAVDSRSEALHSLGIERARDFPPSSWVAYTFTADPTGKDLAQFAAV